MKTGHWKTQKCGMKNGTHRHAHTCTQTHAHIHTQTHTYVHTDPKTHTHTHTQKHTHTNTHAQRFNVAQLKFSISVELQPDNFSVNPMFTGYIPISTDFSAKKYPPI